MAHKKRKVPRLIVRQNAFSRFLNENYGYTDIRQYTTPQKFSSRLNSIFLAKDAAGQEIFIKACRYGDMSENEYIHGLELWKQAPDHFAKPLAYYSGKTNSFCSSEYRPGKDLHTLLVQENGENLSAEQKAQMVEDLYEIAKATQRANVVHCDLCMKNLLLHNGRIVLIDCQFASSPGETRRLSIFNNALKLCLYRWLLPIGANVLEWDDICNIYSLIQYIGTDDAHRERYNQICSELATDVGKFKYIMPYPDLKELNHAIRVSYLRSLFHPKSKLRSRYRHVTEQLRYLKEHHPDLTCHKSGE